MMELAKESLSAWLAGCSSATQMFYNRCNVVVLEEANGGDARSSCSETGMGIREHDPPQCQYRDVGAACLAQKVEARRSRLFFSKTGPKRAKVAASAAAWEISSGE